MKLKMIRAKEKNQFPSHRSGGKVGKGATEGSPEGVTLGGVVRAENEALLEGKTIHCQLTITYVKNTHYMKF